MSPLTPTLSLRRGREIAPHPGPLPQGEGGKLTLTPTLSLREWEEN